MIRLALVMVGLCVFSSAPSAAKPEDGQAIAAPSDELAARTRILDATKKAIATHDFAALATKP